jgi:hypothetical protein
MLSSMNRRLLAVFFPFAMCFAQNSSQITDPEYKKLRDAQLSESFVIENVTIVRDVATLTLKNGTFSFTPAVLGRPTAGVFIGEGQIAITPPVPWELAHLKLLTGQESLSENFDRAVVFFTDKSYEQIKANARQQAVPPAAVNALKDMRDRLRTRPTSIRSMTEALLNDETVDNIEADTLADLYNPRQPGFFNIYLHGRKYSDLRFHVRPRGALPSLAGPEEIALINLNPGSADDGILYLGHSVEEYRKGTAISREDKRSVSAESYRIYTKIQKNEHLDAKAGVGFRGVTDGDRVIKFGLLPTLRVHSVSIDSTPVPFVQEDKKADGSFYVILPQPMSKDQTYHLTIEYAGDQVVHKAGGGNFYVEARTSWYPSLNSFGDQAKYDLTFESPRQYTLVSVGNQVKSTRQGDFTVSQWVSETPLAVAGFNYGDFKKTQVSIKDFPYVVEGYAASTVPDYLRSNDDLVGTISPNSLMNQTLSQADVSIRVFEKWFGRPPYGRIAITQQPDFSFGQSWPGLVYLPVSAFLDSTQRWRLLDGISKGMNDFIQEVTPHEVAHQWWGHMVGWASYRDQWLSEGFADFSAGLFLQLTNPKPDKYLKFLETSRNLLLEKNEFGLTANEAGPIAMGLRLSSERTPGAYQRVTYQKGGYVLHMLRSLMWDSKTGDADFIAMMHDFVQTHLHKAASTESFMAVVEKHMSPKMDLAGDKKMTWFFRQWVYGTEMPRFKFDYTVTQEEKGFRLKGSLAQSGVSDGFIAAVPIYVDLETRQFRLGSATMRGSNAPLTIDLVLPEKPKKVSINANYDVLSQK